MNIAICVRFGDCARNQPRDGCRDKQRLLCLVHIENNDLVVRSRNESLALRGLSPVYIQHLLLFFKRIVQFDEWPPGIF